MNNNDLERMKAQTLENLKNANVKSRFITIDTTTGKVVNPEKEVEEIDPIFAQPKTLTPSNSNSIKTDKIYSSAAEFDAAMKPQDQNTVQENDSIDESEIANSVIINKQKLVPIDINEIIPKKEKSSNNTYASELFSNLDMAIAKDKKKIIDTQNKILEEQYKELSAKEAEPMNDNNKNAISSEEMKNENIVLKEEEDDIFADMSPTLTTRTIKAPENVVTPSEINEEDLLKDLDGDKEEIPDAEVIDQKAATEAALNSIKTYARQNIIPVRNKVDLDKFTIKKSPVSITKIFKSDTTNLNVADWVLLSSNRAFTISALSGPEIVKLNVGNTQQNRLNTFRTAYNILYNHIIDANKPNFESWLKSTKVSDLEHLHFGAYMATFAGSSYVTFACPNTKCNHAFMKDIKPEEFVKYNDKNVKAKVKSLLDKDSTSIGAEYEAELKQISDDYVIAIKSPSIYDAIIQNASLAIEFVTKYADLIDTIAYIDEIYHIDRNDFSLTPVDMLPDEKNQNKTAANKIRICYEVLKKLTSDQYYDLNTYINKMEEKNSGIDYIIPAVTCPKCGTLIPEDKEKSAEDILFMRHQLGVFVSM